MMLTQKLPHTRQPVVFFFRQTRLTVSFRVHSHRSEFQNGKRSPFIPYPFLSEYHRICPFTFQQDIHQQKNGRQYEHPQQGTHDVAPPLHRPRLSIHAITNLHIDRHLIHFSTLNYSNYLKYKTL